MEKHPKFIVEATENKGLVIILGKCSYHKELAKDISKIKGGGWWIFNSDKKEFTLYGESFDFGPASLENIAECVQNKKVFSSHTQSRNLSEEHKFIFSKAGRKTDLETFKI